MFCGGALRGQIAKWEISPVEFGCSDSLIGVLDVVAKPFVDVNVVKNLSGC